MRALTQPLRDEYEALLGRVEVLRTVADAVATAPAGTIRRGVDAALAFLREEVVPMACAEYQAQYPVVGRLLGSVASTAPMAKECQDLQQLTDELRQIRLRLDLPGGAVREANDVRRVLYGLYELLRVHVLSEQQIYVPLLEARLSAADAHQMVNAMADAEERAAR